MCGNGRGNLWGLSVGLDRSKCLVALTDDTLHHSPYYHLVDIRTLHTLTLHLSTRHKNANRVRDDSHKLPCEIVTTCRSGQDDNLCQSTFKDLVQKGEQRDIVGV